MAVQTIKLVPSTASYATDYAKNSLSVKLEGGRSRFSLNKKNGVEVVNVQYNLDGDGYEYFRAFYNTATKKGALPFTSWLFLEQALNVTRHSCKFVPGSVKLISQSGERFIVGATIEATPLVLEESNAS